MQVSSSDHFDPNSIPSFQSDNAPSQSDISPTSSSSSSVAHFDVDRTAATVASIVNEHLEKDYQKLLTKLKCFLEFKTFSDEQKANIITPFIDYIENIGEERFNRLMNKNTRLTRSDEQKKEAIIKLTKALFQYSDENSPVYKSTQAFAALVEEFFKIDCAVSDSLPPLPLWSRGNPNSTPSAFKASIIFRRIKVNIGIVEMPDTFRTEGVYVWASLSHEVAGHIFIGKNASLIEEFVGNIESSIDREKDRHIKQVRAGSGTHSDRNQVVAGLSKDFDFMSPYLTGRIEELACDVLGILSGGPSYALGFIGFMRGMRRGFLQCEGPKNLTTERTLTLIFPVSDTESTTLTVILNKSLLPGLRKSGVLGTMQVGGKTVVVRFERKTQQGDVHPIDVLRPLAMLKVISMLSIDDRIKENWMNLIQSKLSEDLKGRKEIWFYATKEPPISGASTSEASSEDKFIAYDRVKIITHVTQRLSRPHNIRIKKS